MRRTQASAEGRPPREVEEAPAGSQAEGRVWSKSGASWEVTVRGTHHEASERPEALARRRKRSCGTGERGRVRRRLSLSLSVSHLLSK